MAEPVFAAEPLRLPTLKSWTMMETIIGITGLMGAIVISLFA